MKKLLCLTVAAAMLLLGVSSFSAYADDTYYAYFDMDSQTTDNSRVVPAPSVGDFVNVTCYSQPNANIDPAALGAGVDGTQTNNYYYMIIPKTGVLDYARGINWNLASTVNDMKYTMSADYMVYGDGVLCSLLRPKSASTYESDLYVEDCVLYFEGEQVGTVSKNEWFHVSAVYDLSSTDGTKVDVFVNGLYAASAEYASWTSGLKSFHTLLGSTTESHGFIAIDNVLFSDEVTDASGAFAAVSTYPADGAADVAVSAPVVINFNHPVDTDSFTESMITVTPSASKTVSWSADNMKATLTFDQDLDGGTEYTVGLTGSISDTLGLSLTASDFSFTTGAGAASLELIETSPAANAVNVNARDTKEISLKFNSPVDPDTLSGITVSPAIANTVKIDDLGVNVTIEINDIFDGYTNYTVSLTGIESVLGAELADTSFTFKTGEALDWCEDFEAYALNSNPAAFSNMSGSVVSTGDAQGKAYSQSNTGKKFFFIHSADENGEYVATAQAAKTVYMKYKLRIDNPAAGSVVGIRGLGGRANFWNANIKLTDNGNGGLNFHCVDGDRDSDTGVECVSGEWNEIGFKVVMDGTSQYTGDVYLNGNVIGDVSNRARNNTSFDILYFELTGGTMYIDDIETGERASVLNPKLELVSSTPADLSFDFVPGASIVLNFNDEVDSSTLDSAITLSTQSGDPVVINQISVSADGKSVTVVPAGLEYYSDYIINIDGSVLKSAVGKEYIGETSISFGTKEAPRKTLAVSAQANSAEALFTAPVGTSGTIIIALYDEAGVLKASDQQAFSLNGVEEASFTAEFDSVADSDYVKAFVWDIADMLPLVPAAG